MPEARAPARIITPCSWVVFETACFPIRVRSSPRCFEYYEVFPPNRRQGDGAAWRFLRAAEWIEIAGGSERQRLRRTLLAETGVRHDETTGIDESLWRLAGKIPHYTRYRIVRKVRTLPIARIMRDGFWPISYSILAFILPAFRVSPASG